MENKNWREKLKLNNVLRCIPDEDLEPLFESITQIELEAKIEAMKEAKKIFMSYIEELRGKDEEIYNEFMQAISNLNQR